MIWCTRGNVCRPQGTTSVDVLAELAQLRSSIGTLTARADAAEARADTAEARADTLSAGASVLHSDVAANTKGVADLGASIKNIDVSVTGLAPDVAANTKGVADLGASIKNVDNSVKGLASNVVDNTKGVADQGAKIAKLGAGMEANEAALGQQIERHARDLAAVNATTAVLETAASALLFHRHTRVTCARRCAVS